MTDLADEVRSRGHYEITVHPLGFDRERLPYEQLWPTVQRCAVTLRGWDFPHAGREESLERLADSIRQGTDWQYFREMWRFFQSGLFTYLGAIHEDWAVLSERWRPPSAPPGGLLGGQDVVARFTEVYEFAARLATTAAGDDWMRISIALKGVRSRQLYMENPARHLIQVYKTEAPELLVAEDVERGRLIADPWAMARVAVRRMLIRFGFDVHESVLTGLQDELRR